VVERKVSVSRFQVNRPIGRQAARAGPAGFANLAVQRRRVMFLFKRSLFSVLAALAVAAAPVLLQQF
jgi:hypothetical protein